MAFGYDQEARIVYLGDSATLYATLYDEFDQPVSADDLVSVQFAIQRPDGTRVVEDGEVQDDGTGFLRYDNTDVEGEYEVVATFGHVDGAKRSTRDDFQVADPFKPANPTDDQLIADKVWAKVEDNFDSSDGGPWMRDMTLAVFSPHRIIDFIDEALFDYNQTQPPTDVSVNYFTHQAPDGHYPELPLIVQGTFLAVVRHLMRSYTEQPAPQGGQITYEDRRDYLQRWGTVYQIEMAVYQKWVALSKRRLLGLGQSKVLVSSKAGRLLPAPLRSRNIGRGYW